MTTICYRNRVLAGDTRVTVKSYILPGHARKVFKFPDGLLAGVAGMYPDCGAFIRWLEEREPSEDPPEGMFTNIDTLMIRPDGAVICANKTGWYIGHDPYYAIGSGWEYAMMAMQLGSSAMQAVRACMQCDKNTGGKVQHVTLDTTLDKIQKIKSKRRK